MLDMDRRIAPLRMLSFLVIAGCLVASAPWYGWWTLFPLLAAGVSFKLAERVTASAKRPEYAIFGAWTASLLMIAGSAALTGGPLSPAFHWVAIPIVTLSARFSPRGVVLGVAIAVALLLAVGFGVDAAAIVAEPPLLMGPLTLVVAVAMLSLALMRSDVEHRSESVIDPLTGMLNRKALEHRVAELAEQAAVTGAPIGVIAGDLDHFKDVNDEHGHAAGDAVLKDVAYNLRKQLRAYDLSYRLGGEEFLILMPGADLDETAQLAESLRLAVKGESVGDGLHVTMSFGIAASEPGRGFDYDDLFAVADGALYEAKHAGRDRVAGGPAALAAPAV
jgi:diguanylate cyclase (GGDEF)-like protein